MKGNPTSSHPSDNKPAADARETVESMTSVYTKGVERLAEVQKKAIDIAAQHSAEVIEQWKSLTRNGPIASNHFLFDLAASSLEQLAITQKGVIDLVVEQNRALTGILKERGSNAGKVTEGFTSLMQQTVDRSVDAQKKLLDYTSTTTKAAFDVMKHYGMAGSPAEKAADSFQHGVDTLIETQKEMLDLAAKPFKAAS
jgi:hypothetical protein